MRSSLTLIIWLAIATIVLTMLLSKIIGRDTSNELVSSGSEFSAGQTGLLSLTPNLMVDDMDKMIKWYTEVLGFEVEKTIPQERPFNRVLLQNGKVIIRFETRESFKLKYKGFKYKQTGGALSFLLKVDNIEELYEELKPKLNLKNELVETSTGNLEFTLRDPSGHILILTD